MFYRGDDEVLDVLFPADIGFDRKRSDRRRDGCRLVFPGCVCDRETRLALPASALRPRTHRSIPGRPPVDPWCPGDLGLRSSTRVAPVSLRAQFVAGTAIVRAASTAEVTG